MNEASTGSSDSASDISERTAVSKSSGLYDESYPEPHNVYKNLELVDVWQFLLSPGASNLRRFEASDFNAGGTAVDQKEGTSYRVVRSTLSDTSGQVVAIKHLIHRESTSSPSRYEGHTAEENDGICDDSIETVLRELRILTHEPIQRNSNIAGILGYGVEPIGRRSSLYLVAQFAPFGTLQDYLRDKEDPNPFDERAEFCCHMANGLAGLHACGIAHGDIKLNNTLVFAHGDGVVVKLSDFGSSLFHGTSQYVGTAFYNAPEVRRGRSWSLSSRDDCCRCDIFSYGLSVWEIIQSGKPFIDATMLADPVMWLNDLAKDDLLLMALQALEATNDGSVGSRRIVRQVLAGTLWDTPEDRIDSAAIVGIFNSSRIFSECIRVTPSSQIGASELSLIEPWSFSRADNLAQLIPVGIQKYLVARLENGSNHPGANTTQTASFDLAICYLSGFGVLVDPRRSCELLFEASLQNDPRALAVCRRVHDHFGIPMNSSASQHHPIFEVEEDLRLAPPASYYSQRIRRHEKVAQRIMVDSVVDIFSGETLVVEKVAMTDTATLERVVGDRVSDVSMLRAVFTNLANKRQIEAEIPRPGNRLPTEPTSLVHLAARLGYLELIKFIIEIGISVNILDKYKGTLLIAACRGGHAPVVEYLIANGANPRLRQENGVSPFHWMMMFQDSDIIPVMELMKSKHPNAMNSTVVKAIEFPDHVLNLEGSPIHFAVSARNLVLTKALLDAGAQYGTHHLFDWSHLSPLDIAVANHCPEITDLLLSYRLPQLQETPLLHLAESKTLKLILLHSSSRHDMLTKTVDRVLESGFFDINTKDQDGFTPLAKAIQRAPCDLDMQVLEVLTKRGAQVNVEVWRLVECLLSRHDASSAPILALLLKTGALKADIELLCRAAGRGSGAIVDTVLKAGVDANELNSQGLSALQCAVLSPGNSHAISCLLDHGADINFKFQDPKFRMKSPLQFCVMLPVGDGDMLDIFISRGASLVYGNGSNIVSQASELFSKVNGVHILKHILNYHQVLALIDSACDDGTIRPLHIACFQGNLDAINILLDAGAEVNMRDQFNPITTIESVAKDPQELRSAWKHSPFILSDWKRKAEVVLLRLLDKTDPGHGRTPLHIAASLGNFERVIELVENGAEPWRGDREKVTSTGLLPPEAHDPDAEVSDPDIEGYIEECRKISQFLALKMVDRAGQVPSFEALLDPLLQLSVEECSPPQLESQYRNKLHTCLEESGEDHLETLLVTAKLAKILGLQQRWSEAEKLQQRVLQAMEGSPSRHDVNLPEARSDRIRILLGLQRLDEAEELAKLAWSSASDSIDRTQDLSSDDSDRKVVASQYIKSGRHTEAVAVYDLCRVWGAQERYEECTKFLKSIGEEVGNAEGFLLPLSRQISCELATNYCAMARWEDARKEVDWLLGSLRFVKAQDFPLTCLDIIKAAKAYDKVGKYEESHDILRRLYDKTVEMRSKKSYYSSMIITERLCLYKSRSNYNDAIKIQQELVSASKRTEGSQSLATQQQSLELAGLYGELDRWLEAGILQSQVVDVLQARLGSNDQNTLMAKKNLCKTRQNQELFDQAEILAREVLLGYEMTHGKDDQIAIKAADDLASILGHQDRCEEAIQICRDNLQKQESTFGELHNYTRRAINDLASTCLRANKFDEAEALCKRAINIYQAMYGDENEATATCMFYLSSVYDRAGKIQECRDTRKQVLELERRIYHTPQESMLYTMTSLGRDHFALQEYDEAILLQKEAIAGYRGLAKNYDIKITEATIALAGSCNWGNRLDEARAFYEEAVEMCRALYGDSHEITMDTVENLMALYTELDLFEEAKPLALEVYKYMEEFHGKDDTSTQNLLKDVISIHKSLELWKGAVDYSKILVASLKRTLGEDHIEVIDAMEVLADSLAEDQSMYLAESWRKSILEQRRRTLPENDERILRAMDKLIATLMERNKYKEAEPLNLELWNIYQDTLGKTHETSLDSQAAQATIYWSQKRFPEAEALELDIISVRSATLGEADPQTLDAVENLSKTYLKQGRYDEAERLASDVLIKRLDQGMSGDDEGILSIRDHLKDVYIATERWPEAEKLAVEELEVRKRIKEQEGDDGVIAALRSLEKIAKGLGEMERAEGFGKQVTAECETRKKRTMSSWFK